MSKPRPASKSKGSTKRSPKGEAGGVPIEASALEGLKQINLYAGGVDIGSDRNFVCVPSHTVKPGEPTVRRFGVFTEDHAALVEWLCECKVTTVAVEATGIYWLSLCDMIEERGIEVVLVDPRSVKAMPGRKSDILDCQWLQQLHTYGLLRGAFRPDGPTRRLRTLTRQRGELVKSAAQHVHQMSKALVEMNVQLNLVVSDIDGETGLRIIEAILSGVHDPEELVKLRGRRIKKSTVAEMKAALRGNYSEDHLLVLRQNLEAWKFFGKQLEVCDEQTMKVLENYPLAKPQAVNPVPPRDVPAAKTYTVKKVLGTSKNAPKVDLASLAGLLRRICGVDLMAVTGLNILSVLMLIGEIGVDMSRWRSAKAFCSWLGLCPGTKISGGKVLSRRTRHVVNRAAILLRIAAMAVGRSDTWLGRFYRRKKAHLGAPKAITATARKLACIIYHMLKYQDAYVPIDETAYESKAREQRLRALRRQAEQLGVEVIERVELIKKLEQKVVA